jgi:hypothetical protein
LREKPTLKQALRETWELVRQDFENLPQRLREREGVRHELSERVSRRGVKITLWIALVLAVAIGLGLGGPPWTTGFWVAVGLFAGVVICLILAIVYISGR